MFLELVLLFELCCCSYDNDGTSKDEIKERFCQTMEFVENYLRDVVCQSFPFADKEKNKLTFEVILSCSKSHSGNFFVKPEVTTTYLHPLCF